MPKYNPVDINVFDLATSIIPDPGAGTDFSWAVPVNSRIEIIYIGFIFTTAVAAANRYVQILGSTPTLSMILGVSTIAQVASKTYGRACIAGYGMEQDLTAEDRIVMPLSPHFILEPGDTLDSAVINLQAADSINSIIVRYRQWVIA